MQAGHRRRSTAYRDSAREAAPLCVGLEIVSRRSRRCPSSHLGSAEARLPSALSSASRCCHKTHRDMPADQPRDRGMAGSRCLWSRTQRRTAQCRSDDRASASGRDRLGATAHRRQSPMRALTPPTIRTGRNEQVLGRTAIAPAWGRKSDPGNHSSVAWAARVEINHRNGVIKVVADESTRRQGDWRLQTDAGECPRRCRGKSHRRGLHRLRC